MQDLSKRKLGLSERQTEVLAAIKELIDANGHSPTYREIAAELDTTASNVSRYINQLKKRGHIDFDIGAKRSIIIL